MNLNHRRIAMLIVWKSRGYSAGGGVAATTLFRGEHFFFFFKIYLFILREREGRKKERERNSNVWLPLVPPAGDLACNPDMCPDWELNQRPFGLQTSTQSTEPHQPRAAFLLNCLYCQFALVANGRMQHVKFLITE